MKRTDEIVLQDAYGAAQELLDRLVRSADVPDDIVICSCTEFPSSWAFGYQTRRFLKGDIMASLVGNGPVVVPKSGGEPYLSGSSSPIAKQLGEEPM